MPRISINARRALELRNAGHTNQETGRIMAEEEGRIMPYLEQSISQAVNKYRKQRNPSNVQPVTSSSATKQAARPGAA